MNINIAARLNEKTYIQDGDSFRSWDERWGDLVLHVVERDYAESLYGPGQTQSVTVTRSGISTRLFAVSTIVATEHPKTGKSARDQSIDWITKIIGNEKMTDSTNKHSDSKTIFEFRAYLDEWERRCNDKIKRAEEDKDESGKIRLAAFIGMQGSHEQLRDIETVRSVLQSFDTYIG